MLQNHYLLISIILAMLAIGILIFRLDKRHTNIRRLVLISVLTCFATLSRILFAPLPYFKPMTAVIILTGVCLGSEAGLLCGAMTALLSNIYFGQGPWTPFQILALAIIGGVAGLLADKCLHRRIGLLIYGIICGIFYSFFMDIYTVVWAYGSFNITQYAAALVTAVPVTILYCISNAVFLYLFEKPFRRKLGHLLNRYNI